MGGNWNKMERPLNQPAELETLAYQKPKKTADILQRHNWFPCKMTSENEYRNSVLMTRHYPDLGSASDWLKQISHTAQPEALPSSG